jgi:hypothetical protein
MSNWIKVVKATAGDVQYRVLSNGQLGCRCIQCGSVWQKAAGAGPPHCCALCRAFVPAASAVATVAVPLKSALKSVTTPPSVLVAKRPAVKQFGTHGHAKLAIARAAAEDCIYSELKTRTNLKDFIVFDVGGACGGFKRQFYRNTSLLYHNLSPIVSPTDVVRNSDLSQFVTDNLQGVWGRQMSACNHKLADCACVVATEAQRIFLFTHSAYYMTPADWAQLSDGDEVFIITHKFPGDHGALPLTNPEFGWVRCPDGRIEMTPMGACGTVYSHPDPGPMLAGTLEGFPVGTGLRLYCIEWKSDIDGGGSTYIYRGVVAHAEVDSPVIVSPQLTAAPISVELRASIQAMCSKLSATQGVADMHDFIVRVVANLVGKHDADPAVVYAEVQREADLAIKRSYELLSTLTENDRIMRQNIAVEMKSQTAPAPIFGPHGRFAPRLDLSRVAYILCVLAFFLAQYYGGKALRAYSWLGSAGFMFWVWAFKTHVFESWWRSIPHHRFSLPPLPPRVCAIAQVCLFIFGVLFIVGFSVARAAVAISVGNEAVTNRVLWREYFPLLVFEFVVLALLWRNRPRRFRAPFEHLKTILVTETIGSVDSAGFLDSDTVHAASMFLSRKGFYRLACNITNTICLGYASPDDMLNFDPKHKIDIAQVSCDKKAQAGAKLLGWTTRPAYVMSSCRCNFQNALVKRHGVRQPKITRSFREATKLIESLLPEARVIYTAELHKAKYEDAWYNKWPRQVRATIMNSCFWDRVLPGRVSSFIKREVNHDKPTKARLIQGYENDATKAAYGPEFMALQKTWCQIFDGKRRFGRFKNITITIASGMTAGLLGDWLRDSVETNQGPFYERDGKNWDATQQREHHLLKQKAFSIAGPEFLKFHDDCFKVKGTAKNLRGGDAVKYTLHGTVKSGHNDTSSGNNLTNLLITFESMEALGVGGDIIVQGDDLLVHLDRAADVDEFIEVEKDLGIKPEARIFEHWQDVSFLSAIWAPTGQLNHPYTFVAKPGRLVSRAFWTTQKMGWRAEKEWASQVSQCVMLSMEDMPVVRVFIGRWLGGRELKEPTWRIRDRDYSMYKSFYELGDCFAWFCDRYDTTEEEIADCERFLNDLPLEPGLVAHPLLEKMMEVDLADIDIRRVGQCDWC